MHKACIQVLYRLARLSLSPSKGNRVTSSDIARRIVEAILAQKLMPGTRLGEQALSMLFDCSRTLVREALMQLAARGIVQVSSRRGW